MRWLSRVAASARTASNSCSCMYQTTTEEFPRHRPPSCNASSVVETLKRNEERRAKLVKPNVARLRGFQKAVGKLDDPGSAVDV
jgi:hypothetical protein